MEEKDKNYILSSKLSLYGMIALIVSIILCNISAGIGGLASIISSLVCLGGCVMGIASKNTRAAVMGGVSFFAYIMILFVGFYAISQGIVK